MNSLVICSKDGIKLVIVFIVCTHSTAECSTNSTLGRFPEKSQINLSRRERLRVCRWVRMASFFGDRNNTFLCISGGEEMYMLK